MKVLTNKGFSLLEILLVITLLSILFAILVTRVNPSNIIDITEDNQREADALTIYQALEQYAVKNNAYPESIKNIPNNSSLYICKTSAPNCTNSNQINLSTILVPTYFSKIPEYSNDTNNSGFYVVKDINGKVGIGGVRRLDETTFVKGLENQSFVANTTLTINCSNPNLSGLIAWGVTANGVTISIPYEGATGQSYSQQTLASTGVTGLTATLTNGNFSNGAGNLTFNITGTPSGVGTANFNSTINGNTCSFAANSTTPPIVTNGLVLNLDAGSTASYPGTGTTWNDLSGNGNHGTLIPSVGGPTYSSANGGALVFDGVNDYVSLGSFFNYQSFTINLWVDSGTSQVQYANIFDNYHTGYRNFVLQQNNLSTNQYSFGVNDSNGNISSSGLMNLVPNTWTNLAFTFSPSTRAIGYINGVLHSEGALAGGRNILYQSQNLSLARWNAGGRYWNGRMSNFIAYNRALTPEEIQQNFNATKGRFGL